MYLFFFIFFFLFLKSNRGGEKLTNRVGAHCFNNELQALQIAWCSTAHRKLSICEKKDRDSFTLIWVGFLGVRFEVVVKV